MYHRRPEDRVLSRNILERENVQLVYSEKTSLEVSPKGTTKALGLRRLCDYLHISPEETVAVGDAENDLEVLAFAGLAVAMGNAKPEVKEICDLVVGDNDHDGIVDVVHGVFGL
jgi:hydroxymethylpyrimidine pyrophosphatase-like HAD family hydrolase